MGCRFGKKITALAVSAALLFGALCLPAAADTILLGDLDTDGVVTVEDARLALRMSVGLMNASDDYVLVGDADGDGTVTPGDARLILRASIGLEDFEGRTVEAILDPYADCAPLPTEIPPAPEINAPSGTFTFTTYGWGHCVGLSQYGAIIMADAGYPYDFILNYYFSGAGIVKDPDYPQTTYYGSEGRVDTYELLCRIVTMEIGGAAISAAALKAQAVAVFTLMEYFKFSVTYRSNIGEAVSSFSKCPERVRAAVRDVIGEYLALLGDADRKPVLTVYGSMVAGRTLSAKEVWGYSDFPVSVSSPFEASLPHFASTKTYTSAEIRKKIQNALPSAVLPDDPAEWIVITKHDSSLDENRGYVFEVTVGGQTLTGVNALTNKLSLGLRSPCYTVTYTP